MENNQNYFHVSPEKIQAVNTYLKTADPITRACLVPVQHLINGSYLPETSSDKLHHAAKHNAYISRCREQMDALLPIILQAADQNRFKPIVDAVFPNTALSGYREEMMRHVSAENDAAKIYEFLSYTYKSNRHISGKGLVMKEMGFNGIGTYRTANGQIEEVALMDEPMRELITRNVPEGLGTYYAQMCQLVRK